MTAPPPGLAPKSPPSWARWTYYGYLVPPAGAAAQYVWTRGPLVVISSLIHAEFRGELRWHWLVSVSGNLTGASRRAAVLASPKDVSNKEKRRATDDELATVRKHFGMDNAEEDNHQPGCGRMLFRLCDARPDDPALCECKETEEVVTEPDGFTWSKERGADADQMRAAENARQLLGRMTDLGAGEDP